MVENMAIYHLIFERNMAYLNSRKLDTYVLDGPIKGQFAIQW